jgi:hypothetical protein
MSHREIEICHTGKLRHVTREIEICHTGKLKYVTQAY